MCFNVFELWLGKAVWVAFSEAVYSSRYTNVKCALCR